MSIPNNKERIKTLLDIDSSLIASSIKTKNFNLFSLQKLSKKCNNINIYIEGDGLSWVTKNKISNDPTPLNPIALRLMKQDNSSCKIYLARPCQYINSTLCENKYWTSGRFHYKIIESYQSALNQIKEKYKNSTFKIIGYSGGGAISLLTAAKRDDVNQIITIAGNLDHNRWTKLHNITTLEQSLNPIEYVDNLKDIDQVHLIGTNDKIIPNEIIQSYIKKFSPSHKIKLVYIKSNHICCWDKTFSLIINSKH